MKVRDINEHFLSRAAWVDREKTCDRVLVGDPEKDVRTCIVAWTPGFDAVKAAVERGADLLLCHEPFIDIERDGQKVTAKRRFAEEHGLAVLRNHDAWDRWPGVGIPWAWAQFLQLGDKPATTGQNGYLHRYDTEPVKFDDFAKRIASLTAKIGEPLIEVVGDPGRPVSKIGTGTGCGCDLFTYLDMGCDCGILTDDGSAYWHHGQYARDIDMPVIVVNHATSEEPGMVTMTQYVNDNIPGVSAAHFKQGCRFRLIGNQ